MKILFLGYAVSNEINGNLSGKSEAGNKMELSIIYRLNKLVDELKIITVYPIAPFPLDRSIIVKTKTIPLGNNIFSWRVGFLNFPVVKQILQATAVYRAAKREIKRDKNTIIMTFNMYPQVGVPAILIKRKFNCRVIPFLADLPIDDNYKRKGLSKVLHKIFNNVTKKCISGASAVIVLNKHARDIFASGKKYLVIDGGFDSSLYTLFSLKNDINKYADQGNKHAVYTGSLAEYSGVLNIIAAMKFVKNPNIILDIYGSGNMADEVRNSVSNNVKFYGALPQKEIFEIQKNAWLLINPRPVEDDIAKVTFPSKIFEYMVSGTPVLTTRLNGFSKDYDGKVFFAENNEPKTLADCINRIDMMTTDELDAMAQAARRFVLKNKTWDIQIKKIYDFLEQI